MPPKPLSGEFIGCVREVSCLRHLVAELAKGGGASALGEGEPGIGKSSLLAVGLADATSLGCSTMSTEADELGSSFHSG